MLTITPWDRCIKYLLEELRNDSGFLKFHRTTKPCKCAQAQEEGAQAICLLIVHGPLMDKGHSLLLSGSHDLASEPAERPPGRPAGGSVGGDRPLFQRATISLYSNPLSYPFQYAQ